MAKGRITEARIKKYVNYFIKTHGFSKPKAITYVAREYELSESLVRKVVDLRKKGG